MKSPCVTVSACSGMLPNTDHTDYTYEGGQVVSL